MEVPSYSKRTDHDGCSLMTIGINRFAQVHSLIQGQLTLQAIIPLCEDVDKMEIEARSPYSFATAYVLSTDCGHAGIEVVVRLTDGRLLRLDKEELQFVPLGEETWQ